LWLFLFNASKGIGQAHGKQILIAGVKSLPLIKKAYCALANKKMNTSKTEKSYKELVVKKCWYYLYINFPKFNQENKIKVALVLCGKDIGSKIQIDPGEYMREMIEITTDKDNQNIQSRINKYITD
jgi:hypothetical protein